MHRFEGDRDSEHLRSMGMRPIAGKARFGSKPRPRLPHGPSREIVAGLTL
jgi:hypothetical protein